MKFSCSNPTTLTLSKAMSQHWNSQQWKSWENHPGSPKTIDHGLQLSLLTGNRLRPIMMKRCFMDTPCTAPSNRQHGVEREVYMAWTHSKFLWQRYVDMEHKNSVYVPLAPEVIGIVTTRTVAESVFCSQLLNSHARQRI